jgi:predicted peptidase
MGVDGRSQLKEGLALEAYRRRNIGEAFPFFILFPQARRSWAATDEDLSIVRQQIIQVREQYSIEVARVIVIGVGNGGRAAIKLVTADPKAWAGIILVGTELECADLLAVDSVPIRWYPDSAIAMRPVKTVHAGLDVVLPTALRFPGTASAYRDNQLYQWIYSVCKSTLGGHERPVRQGDE